MDLQGQALVILQEGLDLITPTLVFLNHNPLVRSLLILIIFLMLGVLLFGDDKNRRPKSNSLLTESVEAIAGGSVAASQLDLAKAYIEMDEKEEAKKILQQALMQGNFAEKNIAKQLLKTL